MLIFADLLAKKWPKNHPKRVFSYFFFQNPITICMADQKITLCALKYQNSISWNPNSRAQTQKMLIFGDFLAKKTPENFFIIFFSHNPLTICIPDPKSTNCSRQLIFLTPCTLVCISVEERTGSLTDWRPFFSEFKFFCPS